MRCEVFEERYDRFEGDKPLPSALAQHLARCPRCTEQVDVNSRAVDLYRLPGADGEIDLTDRVMAALPFVPRPQPEMPLRNWLLPGALLIASTVLVPILAVFSRVIDAYGSQWLVPFVLVFGFSITIFISFFIKTHMNELSDHFGLNEER